MDPEKVRSGIEHVFTWIEWALVIAAIKYVGKAHDVALAQWLAIFLTILIGLHVGTVVPEALPLPKSKTWMRLVAWGAPVLIAALAINRGLGVLVEAVVASQGAS